MTTGIRADAAGYGALQNGGVDVLRFGNDNSGQLAGFRNKLINGCARVIQRAAPLITNSSLQYGQVDRIIGTISATSVTDGSIIQVTGAPTKSTKAVGLYQVSTTGSTTGGFIQRIEAANCADLKNQTCVMSGLMYQDTGSTINMVLGVYKANSIDNFGAVTQVGSSVIVPVPSGVWTPIVGRFQIGVGDAGTGLDIRVAIPAIAALTLKSFYLGDWQFEAGSIVTPFENRPFGLELALCRRYYDSIGTVAGTAVDSAWALFPAACRCGNYRAFPTITAGAVLNATLGLTMAASVIPTVITNFMYFNYSAMTNKPAVAGWITVTAIVASAEL